MNEIPKKKKKMLWRRKDERRPKGIVCLAKTKAFKFKLSTKQPLLFNNGYILITGVTFL